MTVTGSGIGIGFTGALLCAGCSLGEDPRRAPLDVEETVDGAPATLTVQGRTLVRKGQWGTARPVSQEAAARAKRELSSLSVDDLAKVLAPVVYYEGYEYGLEGPDLEVATRVYKGLREPPREERDERVQRRDNTAYPQSTYLFSEKGCSGTMISRSVALTAAHCVYNTAVNPNHVEMVPTEPNFVYEGVERLPRWTAGVDAQDFDPFPFVHNFARTYEVACTAGVAPNCTSIRRTLPGSHMQCYSLFYTQGWVDSVGINGEFREDFAFVNFAAGACGGHPGDQTGFIPPRLSSEADIESVDATTFGYPKVSPNGTAWTRWWNRHSSVPATTGDAIQTAQIWGSTGQAWIGPIRGTLDEVAANSHEVRINMTVTDGQSGSSVWQMVAGQPRVIGVVSRTTSGASYNRARRWDATVDSLARAYTAFPN